MSKRPVQRGVSGNPSKRAQGKPQTRWARFVSSSLGQGLMVALIGLLALAGSGVLAHGVFQPQDEAGWATTALGALMLACLLVFIATYAIEFLDRRARRASGKARRGSSGLTAGQRLQRLIVIMLVFAVGVIGLMSALGASTTDSGTQPRQDQPRIAVP